MKKSLTIKMFLLIFTSIVVLFTIMGSFQYVYYSKFYEKSKIEETAKRLEEYVNQYEKENWTQEEGLIQAKNFNIENNAYLDIAVFDTDIFTEMTSYFQDKVIISAVSDNQVVYDFLLTDLDYEKVFDNALTKDNLEIIISGVIDEFQTIYPSEINSIDVVNLDDIPVNSEVFSENLTVIEVYDPSTPTVYLSNEIQNLSDIESNYEADPNQKTGKFNDIEYTVSSLSNTSIKQVNFYYTKVIDGTEHSFYVNLSLQSVSESMVIYKKFLPLIIMIMIVIALIVSLIYSKHISRPIVEITGVANNMSHLNFDTRLSITREDELGVLSKSINRLSDSLEVALDDLSEANVKLKEDYENEIRQELIRKNFVANVSHELKTPLGIIKSYAEGIKDVVKKDKQDYYIDVIIDEIDRMDILLHELLDLSKLDGGHIHYKIEPFDLKETLDKIIQYNQTFFNQNKLEVQLTGSFPIIQADKEKMYRALNNLISNALKYALPDTTITISGHQEDHFTLEIENECMPLTEEQNKLIWHRFYKADESHSKEIEGNGLGLSIVKSIIEGHHYACSSHLKETSIVFAINFSNQL